MSVEYLLPYGAPPQWLNTRQSLEVRRSAFILFYMENSDIGRIYSSRARAPLARVAKPGEAILDLAFRQFEMHNPGLARRYVYRIFRHRYARYAQNGDLLPYRARRRMLCRGWGEAPRSL